jgi:hypothetical protein
MATSSGQGGETVRVVRRIAADSLTGGFVTRCARSLRRMDDRLEAGVRGDWSDRRAAAAAAQLHVLAEESRVIGALRSLLGAPSAALTGSGTARWLLDPVQRLAVQDRIRTAGIALVAAVLTHIAIMAIVRVPVGAAGWSMRGALLVAGAIAISRPDALASAWKQRTSRRG